MRHHLFSFFTTTLTFLLFIGVVGNASAKNFPEPTGFVSTCCTFMTEAEKSEINEDLSAFQQETSNQVALAIVQNLEGDSVENYANELFRYWGIGEKAKNNGVLLLFALDERKIRIEVGYGLEGVLTDALAGRIIRDEITPLMKEGKYVEASKNGLQTIKKAVVGEYNEASPSLYRSSQEFSFQGFEDLFAGLVGIFLIFGNLFMYFLSYLARSKSIWAGGIAGGALGLLVLGSFGITVVTGGVFLLLVVLGFILDGVLSANYQYLKKHGKSTSFWETSGGLYTFGSGYGSSRNSTSSGSSSSSSFGGFGGGSSGGGGASGGW